MDARFAPFAPLFDAFEAAGHQLLIVGGCVRDYVMGATEIGDVDLATDATPDETTAALTDNGFKAIPLGERFGTITTLVSGMTVEITTFRVGEVYERGSRHPVVQFGTDIRADLARRDLSINAMAMRRDGEIVDPYDGRGAIREAVLEVPGGGYENTISILRDDPLRLLRIARFAGRFGFHPTDDTSAAARVAAPELADISRERWRVEVEKLLVSAHVPVGLEWLAACGGLAQILPETVGMDATQVAACAARIHAAPSDVVTRWAILMLSAARPAGWFRGDGPTPPAELAADLARRFRLSNRDRAALAARLQVPESAAALTVPWSAADARRAYVDAPMHAHARLDVAEALADGDGALLDALAARRATLDAVLAAGDPTPRFPPKFGRTLSKALGLQGQALGEAMGRLKEALLDGTLANDADPDAYVAYVRAEADAGGADG